MKNVHFICSILLVGLVFHSCNKSEVDTIEKSKLSFVYEGISYETLYQIVGDEKIYDDEEVANIYSGLLEKNLFPLINTDNSIEFFEDYDDFLAKKIIPFQKAPSISSKSFSAPATSRVTIKLFVGSFMTGNYDLNYLTVSESTCIEKGIDKDFMHNNAYWYNNFAVSAGAKSFNASVVKTAGSNWESCANGYVILTDASGTGLSSAKVNLNGGATGHVNLPELNISTPIKMAEFLATYY